MGLELPAEEAGVVLPRLHHDGKIGKLRRTVVDVETVKVVLYDALHGVAAAVAVGFVNLHEHVEHINEDMTAAHAGVDAADSLRF